MAYRQYTQLQSFLQQRLDSYLALDALAIRNYETSATYWFCLGTALEVTQCHTSTDQTTRHRSASECD